MNLLAFGIFQLVELVFSIVIAINITSYIISFVIIYKENYSKTFIKTIKEGWSKEYLTQNILNLSLLVTSISIFWFMLLKSSEYKIYPVQKAIHNHIYITSYILISCFTLICYGLFISIKNIRRTKKLTPVLGYLNIWHSVDNFVESIGGSPITGISTYFRKHLIHSEVAGYIVSSIIWMILEYVYKILIVIALLYLVR
jgi:hypothetical protein